MPADDYIKRSDAMRCKYTFEQGNGVEIEPIEAVPVSYLQNIPAADVEPVKHGHWIPINRINPAWGPFGIARHKCSECGSEEVIARKRCPECGARMMEE